mgnify:CR=1 FL=1
MGREGSWLTVMETVSPDSMETIFSKDRAGCNRLWQLRHQLKPERKPLVYLKD